MTDSQRKAVAAGFLHALSVDQDVAKEWMATKKDDHAAVGALIQKTMGLATAPSTDDINAMAQYVDSHLKDHTEKIAQAHPGAAHAVGFIAIMQQN
jgi:hypothetical protein